MKTTYTLAGVFFILVLGAFTWYGYTPTKSETASTTQETLENTAASGTDQITGVKKPSSYIAPKKVLTYNNQNYGFAMSYPKTTKPETSFRTFYLLSNNWRAKATPLYRGTPVVSFIIHKQDNNTKYPKQYPLYFTSEVRLGVSTDITNCFAKDEGYASQKITDVVINGVTWKRFSFSDAAMMQYVQGESYRTVRNKQCFVLEQIKAGSNYKEEGMATGTSDTLLTAYYNEAESVLKTFRFTR